MDAKVPCRQTLQGSDMFVGMYLKDLSDEDILIKPLPGMNPIAWQLGHLISVERMILETIQPGSSPALPEGFDAAHGKGKGQAEPPAGFSTLAEYQALWKAQRDATLALLEAQSDADLDKPNPVERLRHRATTLAELFNFIGLHTMLHVGQFVAVRRAKERPIAL
ncbi:DinB family protein [Tundrisphaera sp. TA3]|uniref:DinB family protein n=1 Tax=Tundrisphaera sp. TA3 TaxID=3435775 RepID=UPI003EBC6102